MGLKIKTSSFVLGRMIIPSKPFPSRGLYHQFFSTKNAPKTSKPLRILFCGSDSFSCESLRALVKEKKRDPEGIASIDVLIRPGKPFGRGLKEIRGGNFEFHQLRCLFILTIASSIEESSRRFASSYT